MRPVALGLAAETYLIRLAAPANVYLAVKTMTAAAAVDVRADAPTLPLFVSIQVETAWGRLQCTTHYVGVARDVTDSRSRSGLASAPMWTSANLSTVAAALEMQARWISRQMQLADRLAPRYLFQLAFTDLDLVE